MPVLMNDRFVAPAGAVFSRDRLYRYLLWRNWGRRGPLMLFIGLNPSTADEHSNDPTIRRCIGFARDHGARGMLVANLYAFRATKPVDLFTVRDPVGVRNNFWIRMAHARAEVTVACWGVHGACGDRARRVLATLGEVCCLGVSQAGWPRHPLYLARGTPLCPYA